MTEQQIKWLMARRRLPFNLKEGDRKKGLRAAAHTAPAAPTASDLHFTPGN
jgi:hypothetical protein